MPVTVISRPIHLELWMHVESAFVACGVQEGLCWWYFFKLDVVYGVLMRITLNVCTSPVMSLWPYHSWVSISSLIDKSILALNLFNTVSWIQSLDSSDDFIFGSWTWYIESECSDAVSMLGVLNWEWSSIVHNRFSRDLLLQKHCHFVLTLFIKKL